MCGFVSFNNYVMRVDEKIWFGEYIRIEFSVVYLGNNGVFCGMEYVIKFSMGNGLEFFIFWIFEDRRGMKFNVEFFFEFFKFWIGYRVGYSICIV